MLAVTNLQVVLGMSFHPFSNADMDLQRACLEELDHAEAILFDRRQEC